MFGLKTKPETADKTVDETKFVDMDEVTPEPEAAPEPEPAPEAAPEAAPEPSTPPSVESTPAAEPVVEPAMEPAADPLETLQRENAALRHDFDRLMAQVQAGFKQAEPEPKEPEIAEEWASEDEYAEALSSREGFNAVLNRVVGKAVAMSHERSLQTVPEMVQEMIGRTDDAATIAEQFYEAHKALAVDKKRVSEIFDKVVKANPNQTLEEAFEATAKLAYQRLRIRPPSTQTPDQDAGQEPPGPLAPNKSSRRPPKAADAKTIGEQIAELEGL